MQGRNFRAESILHRGADKRQILQLPWKTDLASGRNMGSTIDPMVTWWKTYIAEVKWLRECLLQWGRSDDAAEDQWGVAECCLSAPASMGPQR